MATIQETMAVAHQAGFSWTQAAVITAIAIQESGLRPVEGPVTADTAGGPANDRHRGYLQFSSTQHPEVSDACANDLRCSMDAAFRVSQGGKDYSAWEAYTTGTYLKFLVQNVLPIAQFQGWPVDQSELNMTTNGGSSRASDSFGAPVHSNGFVSENAAGNVLGNAVASGGASVASGFSSVTDAVGSLAKTVGGVAQAITSRNFWERVLTGWAGIMLVGIGIVIIFWPQAQSVAMGAVAKRRGGGGGGGGEAGEAGEAAAAV